MPDIFKLAETVSIGVASTIITILIFLYIISPRIRFSRDVHIRNIDHADRQDYRIRVKRYVINNLIDCKILCNILIKDIGKNNKNIWTRYKIPTSFEETLRFPVGLVNVKLKIHKSNIIENPDNFIIRSNFPQFKSSGELRFEDIFMAFDNVYIIVFVIGHDPLTGVKKLYTSSRYYFHNFRHGRFQGFFVKSERRKPKSS